MISIGKSLNAHLNEHKAQSVPATPVTSPLSATQPQVVAVHNSPTDRFRMEIGFETSGDLGPEGRKERCSRLLLEMEDLFREYEVINMKGDYKRHGFSSPIS